jgi:autotransporter-associated beta strand protein
VAGAALFGPFAIESADAAACTDSVGGNSGPVTNSAAINCIFIVNATVAGNVTNTGTGTINAPGPGGPSGTGITVGNSTINGAIINNGSIAALFSGISIDNVTATGGITNTGTISSASANYAGIEFNINGSFSGPIDNTGTISGGFGIAIGVPTFSGGVTNSGSINATHDGIAVEGISSFAGGITNSGTITATNFNAIQISDTKAFSGGVTNSGKLSGNEDGIFVLDVPSFQGVISNGSTGVIVGSVGIGASNTPSISIFNSGTITGTGGNAIQFDSGVNTLTLGPGFAINGNVVGVGSDILQLGGTGTGSFDLDNIGTQYTGFATFNVVSGTWVATGTGNQNWTIAGGTLQLGNGGTSGAINGNIVDNGTFAIDRSDAYTFAGNISGTGSFVQMGTGTTVLTGASSYIGPTNVTAGTLQAGAANVFAPASSFTISAGAVLNLNSFNQTIGSLGGAGNVTLGSATLTAGGNNANTAFSGAISGGGGLTKAGSGTLILSGSNGYTGATNINGGTLEVDGAITSSSNVTVNVGGKLTGSGTVDPSTITIASGATFAPGTPGVAGTSMTVAGNLAFQSGAMYLVQINPTTASSANVTGTASLGGTVQAVFASGIRYSAFGGPQRQHVHDVDRHQFAGQFRRQPELHCDRRAAEPHVDTGTGDRHRRP